MYELLADEARDIVLFVRAADGAIVEANAAAMTVYGYAREELLRLTIYDLRATAEGPKIRAQMDAADADGILFETEHRRKDGSVFPVEVSSRGTTTLRGERVLLSIVRDITARRRMEERLREQEERYRLLFENSSEGVLLTRPDGSVMAANPQACRIFARTEEDIRRIGRSKLVDPGDPRLAAALQQREKTGTFSGELNLMRGDGTVFPGEILSKVYEDHDGNVLTSMIVRDLTERKRAEEEIARLQAELRQRVVTRTAQLEATNEELEALVYSISHDLRTPLRAIDGFSAEVLESSVDRLGPEDADDLRRVRLAAQRMARLVDGISALSRSSRRDLVREHVDVSAIAESVTVELRSAWPERRVETVIAPGLAVDADAGAVRVILRHLLDNAWKFTARREEARIEVGVIDADGERAFFVRDDGAGFDPRVAQHLFGAFRRMHTETEFEGPGIGLATVRRLVSRHGGRVWAEAEVEKGATFYFTLPPADAGG